MRAAGKQPRPMNFCDVTKSKDSSLYESRFPPFMRVVVLRQLWMGCYPATDLQFIPDWNSENLRGIAFVKTSKTPDFGLERLVVFFFAASRVSGNPFSVLSTTQNVQRPTAKLHDQGHDKHHNITDDHSEDSKIGLPYFQLTSCTCPNRLGRDLRFVKSFRSSLVADRPMCSNLLFRCFLNVTRPLALVFFLQNCWSASAKPHSLLNHAEPHATLCIRTLHSIWCHAALIWPRSRSLLKMSKTLRSVQNTML